MRREDGDFGTGRGSRRGSYRVRRNSLSIRGSITNPSPNGYSGSPQVGPLQRQESSSSRRGSINIRADNPEGRGSFARMSSLRTERKTTATQEEVDILQYMNKFYYLHNNIKKNNKILSKKYIFKDVISDIQKYKFLAVNFQYDDYKDKLNFNRKLSNAVTELKDKYGSKGKLVC
jgi:hypothetical protein